MSDPKYTKYTLRNAAYIIEATQFESLCLWEQNSRTKRVQWEHVSAGYLHECGKLAEMPVTVSISFAILNGVLVAFYEPTSQVVDHRMVEAWLQEESPAYAAGMNCDGINFNHCLKEIRHLPKIAQPTD